MALANPTHHPPAPAKKCACTVLPYKYTNVCFLLFYPEPYIYGGCVYGKFGREITKYTVVYGISGMCHTAYSYNTSYRINAYFTVLNKLGRIIRLQNLPFFAVFGFL